MGKKKKNRSRSPSPSGSCPSTSLLSSSSTSIKVFVDLDGTLVDFHKGVHGLLGRPHTEDSKGKTEMWAAIKSARSFWSDLEWLIDGKELWEGVCKRSVAPTILTGVPVMRGFQQPATAQKTKWCKINLGQTIPVICCAPKVNKRLHAARNCILIDDDITMRTHWQAAGGIFVLRTTAAETLAAFDQALKRLREGGEANESPNVRDENEEQEDEKSDVNSIYFQGRPHVMLTTSTLQISDANRSAITSTITTTKYQQQGDEESCSLKILQQLQKKGGSLTALAQKHKLILRQHPVLPLIQISYSQIESSMASPLVQECRGLILEKDTWRVIALPFTKFFNSGEKFAHAFDWESGSTRVYDKLDGSLMTLYYYEGRWHVASNKLPAADGKLPSGRRCTSLAEYFWTIWDSHSYQLPQNTQRCYMFELLLTDGPIIVRHAKDRLVCLGGRDMNTLQEIPCEVLHAENGWDIPQRHDSISSLEHAHLAARNLDPVKFEGFVAVDRFFTRLKIKSPSYVALHHLVDNQNKQLRTAEHAALLERRLLEIVRANEGSEFLAYYPKLKPAYEAVRKRFAKLVVLVADKCETKDRVSRKLESSDSDDTANKKSKLKKKNRTKSKEQVASGVLSALKETTLDMLRANQMRAKDAHEYRANITSCVKCALAEMEIRSLETLITLIPKVREEEILSEDVDEEEVEQQDEKDDEQAEVAQTESDLRNKSIQNQSEEDSENETEGEEHQSKALKNNKVLRRNSNSSDNSDSSHEAKVQNSNLKASTRQQQRQEFRKKKNESSARIESLSSPSALTQSVSAQARAFFESFQSSSSTSASSAAATDSGSSVNVAPSSVSSPASSSSTGSVPTPSSKFLSLFVSLLSSSCLASIPGSAFAHKGPGVVLLMGLPGSGKSTLRNTLISRYPQLRVRVISQDELKTKPKCLEASRKALAENYTIIVDRVNFDASQRAQWLELVPRDSGKKLAIILATSVEDCIERVMTRKGHPSLKPSPDVGKIVRSFTSTFTVPLQSEVCHVIAMTPPRLETTVDDLAALLLRWQTSDQLQKSETKTKAPKKRELDVKPATVPKVTNAFSCLDLDEDEDATEPESSESDEGDPNTDSDQETETESSSGSEEGDSGE